MDFKLLNQIDFGIKLVYRQQLHLNYNQEKVDTITLFEHFLENKLIQSFGLLTQQVHQVNNRQLKIKFKQIFTNMTQSLMGIQRIEDDSMFQSHLIILMLNTFVLIGNIFDKKKLSLFIIIFNQIDMVLVECFRFNYDFQRMDKMIQLASILNIIIRLYFLELIYKLL